MQEETIQTKLTVENVYKITDLTVETGATIDETTYKVNIAEENVYKVEQEPEPVAVKVLMLKGEKGDPGSGGGGAGTYADLPDKPSINGTTLVGAKSIEDLNVYPLTNLEIEELLNNN